MNLTTTPATNKKTKVQEAEDESSSSSQIQLSKGSWTPEEDRRLLEAVSLFPDDWNQVKTFVQTRTVKQCKDRYKLKLDPSIVTAPWSRDEDELLLVLSREHGRSWTKIAKQLPGRTENGVKARIATLERKKQSEWNAEDDLLLRQLKQRIANGEAVSFAQYFPNRTEHSIAKRWDALMGEDIANKVRLTLAAQQQQHSLSEATAAATADIPSVQYLAYPPTSSSSSQQQLFVPNFVPNGMRHLPKSPPLNNRLKRQSTSMTVLLHVLNERDPSSPLSKTASLIPSSSSPHVGTSVTAPSVVDHLPEGSSKLPFTFSQIESDHSVLGSHSSPRDDLPATTPGQQFLQYMQQQQQQQQQE